MMFGFCRSFMLCCGVISAGFRGCFSAYFASWNVGKSSYSLRHLISSGGFRPSQSWPLSHDHFMMLMLYIYKFYCFMLIFFLCSHTILYNVFP